ncbi:hypothetical protein [Candidatus Chloroploca sp. Khr17]|uniref:TolB family protein n=1 Tax=Candidatus Chloroploca sp. Khr17 TaxID=2496869 RepID=UPI00101D6B44|nr:hypothetical protein [Candidatus Chloroploca sp. Khr17]
MTLNRFSRALLALPLMLMLLLASCDLTTAGEREEIAGIETILALTPSPTPTASSTPAPTSTPTITPIPSPTQPPTLTPLPTSTPLPPTPTPNPALVGFGFCDQSAGDLRGLFSARLVSVEISGNPAYEQVVLNFEPAPGSSPIGALASCVSANDNDQTLHQLEVYLPGWIRDARFEESVAALTQAVTRTRTLAGVQLVPANDGEAGAVVQLALNEPLPFRLNLSGDPAALTIAVARTSSLTSANDALALGVDAARAELAAPLFMLLDGDIWRIEHGTQAATDAIRAENAGAVNLTDSPETETHLAVSHDGSLVAFCRALPGLDPAETELPVPSVLWLMETDGTNQRPIAQIGVSCADPAFSLDDKSIAFAVDETGAMPIQRAIYSVPTTANTSPRRMHEGVDEWGRSSPQWLDNGDMVIAATSQDGRSTLFLRRANGTVVDVGAAIFVRDDGETPYSALGQPLVAPDGKRFAVEAWRNDERGADLVVLDADGTILDMLGTETLIDIAPGPRLTPTIRPTSTAVPTVTPTSLPTEPVTTTTTAEPTLTPTATTEPEQTVTPTATPLPTATPMLEPVREGPFWTRALGWDDNGHLVYLTTLCASQAVQDYQIYRWNGAQRTELILAGQRRGGIGQTVMQGDQLAYVLTGSPAGPRVPVALTPRNPVELWLWDLAEGTRGRLLITERGMAALQR